MTIWKPPTVNDQPYVKLFSWAIFKVDNDLHLAGVISPCEGEGRVTSKIIKIECYIVETRSTRKYQLYQKDNLGQLTSNGQYVLNRWLHFNKIDRNQIQWYTLPQAIEFLQTNRSENGKKD
jgi:hypothetical protein